MRKRVFGRQLQRDTNERKALFKSLIQELILHETIITTEAKAKSVRGQVEKFVTKVKKNSEEALRVLQSHFAPSVLSKLVSNIAPRFDHRPGGYTRIIKIGNRTHDNAKIVILEWTEKASALSLENKSKKVEQLEATTLARNVNVKTKMPAKKKSIEKKVKKTEKKLIKKPVKKNLKIVK